MTQRLSGFLLILLLSLSVGTDLRGQEASAVQKTKPDDEVPLFRSRVTRVPIDVTVVDSKGRPIEGLTSDDFLIFEDGRPQKIVHFSTRRYPADSQLSEHPTKLSFSLPDGEGPSDSVNALPDSRTVLIVLGHVGLNEELGTYFQAIKRLAASFEKQGGGDRVAIMAYNRISDFTLDKKAVAALLYSYIKHGRFIESSLVRRNSHLLVATQPNRILPQSLRKRADRIFEESPLDFRETVTPYIVSNLARKRDNSESVRLSHAAQASAQAAAVIRAGQDIVASSGPGIQSQIDPNGSLGLAETAEVALLTDLSSISAYQSRRSAGDADLSMIFSAVEYLRFLGNEKHLIFIAPQGILLPRVEDYEEVARTASHYRIRVHTIHTGKVYISPPEQIQAFGERSTPEDPIAPSRGSFSELEALDAVRKTARMTGGLSYFHSNPDQALAKALRSLSVAYLLAYQPTAELDGRYRRIRVKTTRPGAWIHARQGYFGIPRLATDDRLKLQAYVRTMSAANTARVIDDLKMSLRVRPGLLQKGRPSYRVNVQVELRNDFFEVDQKKKQGTLVMAYFFKDDEKGIWSVWDKVGFDLDEPSFQKIKDQGLRIEKVFHPPEPLLKGWLKVVAYDMRNERIGTVTQRLYSAAQ